MNYAEQPVVFECEGESLVGIASRPERPRDVGVVVIVGGPQYRAGSHRQFVLLARHLAENGVATFRFDYRGMGDSAGAMRTFEDIDADIRAAIDTFVRSVPEARRVVLWGLCDAASAACLYAPSDSRVAGLALLNPWVHTEAGEAKAYVRHYYWRRVLSPDFWKKVVAGGLNLGETIRDFGWQVARAARLESSPTKGSTPSESRATRRNEALPIRMLASVQRFNGPLLLVVSSQDLVAAEFSDLARSSRHWRAVTSSARATSRLIAGANHTFSAREWRDEVARQTLDWVLGSAST
jgi:exosortase A-associated hydrolase 1